MAGPARAALIFGIGGQDGALLARLLRRAGLAVHGTSRDKELARFENLGALGIADGATLHSCVPTDFRSVFQVVNAVRPDFIFYLAGQSSVGLSFSQPVETLQSIALGALNILEAMRLLKLDTRFYNASSSESFGDTAAGPADEATPFRPRSPYGIAKATAHWIVANYRESYGLFAASGILFNHESPLRAARFVTRKIIRGVAEIRAGRQATLTLGNLDVVRDWGWAPDYVEAIWRMVNAAQPEDFVIATGEGNRLADFAAEAFAQAGLRWTDHVVSDARLLRPSEITVSIGDPRKAERVLGWRARLRMKDIVARLLAAELAGTADPEAVEAMPVEALPVEGRTGA